MKTIGAVQLFVLIVAFFAWCASDALPAEIDDMNSEMAVTLPAGLAQAKPIYKLVPVEPKRSVFKKGVDAVIDFPENHPRWWKGLRLTGKGALFSLNLAAAAGNTFRWGH